MRPRAASRRRPRCYTRRGGVDAGLCIAAAGAGAGSGGGLTGYYWWRGAAERSPRAARGQAPRSEGLQVDAADLWEGLWRAVLLVPHQVLEVALQVAGRWREGGAYFRHKVSSGKGRRHEQGSASAGMCSSQGSNTGCSSSKALRARLPPSHPTHQQEGFRQVGRVGHGAEAVGLVAGQPAARERGGKAGGRRGGAVW